MSFYRTGGAFSFNFGDIDLTKYMRAFDLQTEPKAITDNPHAPGTPDHRRWECENVHTPRQYPYSAARRDAKAVADERIAKVRATYRGRGEAPTFAYGKTVDDLVAFVADDKATCPDLFAEHVNLSAGSWPSFDEMMRKFDIRLQPWQSNIQGSIT